MNQVRYGHSFEGRFIQQTILLPESFHELLFLTIKLHNIVSVHTLFHITVNHSGIIPLLLIFLTHKPGNQGHNPARDRNNDHSDQCQPPVDCSHHDNHPDQLENTVNRICTGRIQSRDHIVNIICGPAHDISVTVCIKII